MSQKIPSQKFLAKIANIGHCSMRSNVRMLLRMVIKNGYTLNKKIAEKMDSETIKMRKRGSIK